MTFGEDHGWGSSAAESARILAAYLDRGGNSVDTANVYTNGHSEVIIGDYLADRPGLREHEARLTAVSAPRLNFPAANNAALARLARNGGTTVDGIPTPPPPRLVEGARVY